MIDTDKYDLGHAVGKWRVRVRKGTFTVKDCLGDEVAAVNDYADAQLIADVPLLLAELKRLREIEQEHGRVTIDDWEHKPLGDVDAYPLPYVTVYHGGCEYVGRLRLYKNEDGEVVE